MTPVSALIRALAPPALAAQIPPIICTNLPGCSSFNPANPNALTSPVVTGITTLANLFIAVAAAVSILGIIWGGLLLLYSNGDDGRVTKARNSIAYALGGLALAISGNAIVSLILAENWGQNVVGQLDLVSAASIVLGTVIRVAVAAFNGGLILVIMWAGYRLLMARGKAEEKDKAIAILKWAFAGAVIVTASRAIVQAFLQTYTSFIPLN